MQTLQQSTMKLLILVAGFFVLGVFNLSVQAEELLTPTDARNHIKEQGIKYREEEFIKSVEEGRLDVAKLFLSAGKDANAENFSGESVLMIAAENGNLEMLKLLLEYSADPNTTGGFYNRSALITAAEQGHLEIVRILLNREAEIESTDKDGNTALLMAARKNFPEIMTLLIEHGADVSVKDNNGKSPVEDIFIKNIEEGDVERVQFLLTAGMNANVKKPFIHTPVIVIAAENGDLALVKMLQEHGTDLNLKDNFGKTALMIALAKENIGLIHFLLDHGADARIQDKYGNTPVENFFITSVKEGDLETVTKLLKARLNPNVKSITGTPALIIAVENSHTELVRALLAFGADVEFTDSRDRTALAIALENDQPEIQELLQKALDIKSEKQ